MSATSEQKPVFFCAVRGSLAPRAMCGHVGCGSDEQGRKRCHSKDVCEHKHPDTKPTGVTHDCKQKLLTQRRSQPC